MSKILHINSYFYDSVFYKNLFNKQISMGTDIAVFVPACVVDNENKYSDLPYVKICRTYNRYDKFFFHIKQKKILGTLENNYKIWDYDMLHAHSLFTNGYVAYRLNKKYNIPYIVAIRNTDINIFFKRMPHLRNIGIKILKNAKKIIYISPSYMKSGLYPYVSEKVYNEFLLKSIVIPNGLDQFWLNNISNKTSGLGNGEKINILSVGKICKLKNMIKVAEACKLLIDDGKSVHFTIVGKTEDSRIYKQLSRYDFVSILPFSIKEDLLEIYRENDIFALPSLRETFGLVYAEAMTQKLPVIYTKNQGFDGQFEDGVVGYSVQPTDALYIKKAIEQCVNNIESLQSACGNLCRKFSWDLIAEKYSCIYEECLVQ